MSSFFLSRLKTLGISVLYGLLGKSERENTGKISQEWELS